MFSRLINYRREAFKFFPENSHFEFLEKNLIVIFKEQIMSDGSFRPLTSVWKLKHKIGSGTKQTKRKQKRTVNEFSEFSILSINPHKERLAKFLTTKRESIPFANFGNSKTNMGWANFELSDYTQKTEMSKLKTVTQQNSDEDLICIDVILTQKIS